MAKQIVTYGLLDERLRALGFTVHRVKKSRVYNHKQTGAAIYLPDFPSKEEVQAAHLVVVRHVLDDYNLDNFNSGNAGDEKGCELPAVNGRTALKNRRDGIKGVVGMKMTWPEWTERIYIVLIGLAHNRQTIRYERLKELIGYEGVPNNLGNPLGRIAGYCHEKGWPILSAVVVNASGNSGDGIPFVEDPALERERIFAFEWYKQCPVRAEEFPESACLAAANQEGA